MLVLRAPVAHADPLSESSDPEPVLPDPVPGTGAYFPPQLVTAGVASVKETLGAGQVSCSAARPCALPSPALDRMIPAQGSPAGIVKVKLAGKNGSGVLAERKFRKDANDPRDALHHP